MVRIFLFLIGVVSLAGVINAQCAASDNPSCASWAKNGFCTNPGYTKEYVQKYCPKTCANCGCTCPSGTTFIASAVNNKCTNGTLIGSVCCDQYVTVSNIIGPEISGGCPTGYVAVKTGAVNLGIWENDGECRNLANPTGAAPCPTGYAFVEEPNGAPPKCRQCAGPTCGACPVKSTFVNSAPMAFKPCPTGSFSTGRICCSGTVLAGAFTDCPAGSYLAYFEDPYRKCFVP